MTTQTGKIRIVRRLASGGMAEVYRAQVVGPEGFEKDICLKRVLPHLARDHEFLEMFKAEARLAAKLQHTNIVQIFDFGEDDGTYFLTMELVDGCDLRGALKVAGAQGRRVPPGLAAYIAAEAAKGLAYAQRREQIVHRDISPHNLLLSWNGEVKVADFGIAKAASRASATRSGVLKGKLAYMAPEQALGEPVDGRSDLFSLGLVLYEMLTGIRPFQGATETETLGRVLHHVIAPPASISPDLPEALCAIAMRALERNREARFASAEEMGHELQRFLFTLPPEEATAPGLSAFLESLRPGMDLLEEPGHTQLAGDAVHAPTITADGHYPVARAGDPTRLRREDTIESAPIALTRSEIRSPARRPRIPRWAIAAAALAGVAGTAAASWWWTRDPERGATPRAAAVSSPPVAETPPPPRADPAHTPAASPVAAPAPVVAPAPLAAPVPPGDEEEPPGDEPALSPPGKRVKPVRRRPPAPSPRATAAAPRPRPKPVSALSVTPPAAEPLRREGTAPEAPVPGGMLQVTAIPWAQVYIDGKLITQMPQTGIPVKAGIHKVRIKNEGRGYDHTFNVNVGPGEARRVVWEIDKDLAKRVAPR
jgi:tRNA A-37 threonylcarbamoyl transferase component Bud32